MDKMTYNIGTPDTTGELISITTIYKGRIVEVPIEPPLIIDEATMGNVEVSIHEEGSRLYATAARKDPTHDQ